MPDVAIYCKSGYPILNGGRVFNVNPLGGHQYFGPTGLFQEAASGSWDRLEQKYTNRFDDPRYYEGDTAN